MNRLSRKLVLETLEGRFPMAYGDLDTQHWGTNGQLQFFAPASGPQASAATAVAAVATADGGMILFGDAHNGDRNVAAFTKIDATGALDEDFATDGKGYIYNGKGVSEAFAQDDKVIVSVQNRYGKDWDFLVRLNSNGTLDGSFGDSGVLSPFRPDNAIILYMRELRQFKVTPSGEILSLVSEEVTGSLSGVSGRMLRFSKNGVLDRSFGVDGVANTNVGSFDIDSQGRIYVLSKYQNQFQVHRFDPSGKNEQLIVTSIFSADEGRNLELDVQDDLVVLSSSVGNSSSQSTTLTIHRFDLNGNRIQSFGMAGKIAVSTGEPGYFNGLHLVRSSEGSLTLVGSNESAAGETIWSMRIKSNGTLDASYGPNGKRSLVASEFLTAGFQELGNGRLAVIGDQSMESGHGMSIFSLDANGSIAGSEMSSLKSVAFDDPVSRVNSFEFLRTQAGEVLSITNSILARRAPGPLARSQVKGIEAMTSIGVWPWQGNTLLSAGYTQVDSNRSYKLVQHILPGSRGAPAFGNAGTTAIPLEVVSDIQVFDGRVYVLGTSQNQSKILRYTNTGLLDTSFAVNGVYTSTELINSNIALNVDGEVYFLTSTNKLVQLSIDGVPTGFGSVDLDLGHPAPSNARLSVDEHRRVVIFLGYEDFYLDTSKVIRVTATGIKEADEISLPMISMSTNNADPLEHWITKTLDGFAVLFRKSEQYRVVAFRNLDTGLRIDTSFGNGGYVLLPFDRSFTLDGITSLPDGSLLVSGIADNGWGTSGIVYRFLGPSINPRPKHNLFYPMNVTSEPGSPELVNPLDVLAVVNEINSGRVVHGTFADVNGDGTVGPLDVLVVVNFLNARPQGSGEGEASEEDSESLRNATNELHDWFFIENEEDWSRIHRRRKHWGAFR